MCCQDILLSLATCVYGWVVKKFMKIKTLKNFLMNIFFELFFFESKNNRINILRLDQIDHGDDILQYMQYVTLEEIRAVLINSGIDFPDAYKDRVLLGDNLVCLQSGNKTLLSYGWIKSSGVIFISELGVSLNLGGKVCLYDFYTPEQHRRKGYYTFLLANILEEFDGRSCLIYAWENNVASISAINRVGFVKTSPIFILLSIIYSHLLLDDSCHVTV